LHIQLESSFMINEQLSPIRVDIGGRLLRTTD
jgi:hypothetical protein